jgi:hypothetical protein
MEMYQGRSLTNSVHFFLRSNTLILHNSDKTSVRVLVALLRLVMSVCTTRCNEREMSFATHCFCVCVTRSTLSQLIGYYVFT